jgi:UDP-glucose 4-epimerase
MIQEISSLRFYARQEFDMPTSLVTGGAGFIGSHVVDALLAQGHRVVALDDLSGGYADNVNPRAAFVQGSITDLACVEKVFAENKIDYVYHLAAYAAEGLSHFIRRFNYTNNVIGSVNLINAAVKHECKCFVFTSSIAVYGAGQLPMTEEMEPRPEDPYGIAKYAVELDLRAAAHMFGLNWIVFRPHNVYGERQNIADKYRNVLGIFMNQVMQGKPCSVFGDGLQKRAFTHVADVAPIIARAVEVPAAYGQVFNLGADTPYTVLELAEKIQAVMGQKTGVTHQPARREVVDAYSTHIKVQRVFGHTAQVDLDTGIRRMAEWARRIGPRPQTPFGDIEIERNLPPSWRRS